MKRILYVLLIFPAWVFAQNASNKDVIKVPSREFNKPRVFNDVSLSGKEIKTVHSKKAFENLFKPVGITNYDLQTNSSTGRRILVHDDGTISVVWTHAQDLSNNTFPQRGTGYNFYDGSDWLFTPSNISRIENTRVGWPNIMEFKDQNGDSYEGIIAHIAAASNDQSGGYVISTNDNIGSQNWISDVQSDLKDPIWYRTAYADGILYMIGTYSVNGTDTVVMDGIRSPTVYFRSEDNGATFTDREKLLPGYADKTRRKYGSADNYAIDARDSIVAILIADTRRDMVLWKSYDYGKTFNMHTILKHPLTIQQSYQNKEFDTTIVSSGSVTLVLDKNGVAHIAYDTWQMFDDDSTDNQYSFLPVADGIYYWNDEHTMDTLKIIDTSTIQKYAYNFTLNVGNVESGDKQDSLLYNTDTAYNYTFNTADSTIDSTALASFWLFTYANYNSNDEKTAFVPTDSMEVWPLFYKYSFDTATGNIADTMSTVFAKKIILDSSLTDITVIKDLGDSVVMKYLNNPVRIGAALDINGNGIPDFTRAPNDPATGQANPFFYNFSPLSTMPTISIDNNNGDLFVVYSAAVEGTAPQSEIPDYKDLYVVYSTDGGMNWALPQNITKSAQSDGTRIPGESVYASANKYIVNGKLQFIWQEDELPGTFVQNEQSFITQNIINYLGIDEDLIIQDEIEDTVFQSGIHELPYNSGPQVSIYPNPAQESLNINFDVQNLTNIKISLINALGQKVLNTNDNFVAAGSHQIHFNLSNLEKGVYIVEIRTDNGITTKSFVKE